MTTRKVQSRQPWRPPKAADENAKAAAADSYRRGPDGKPEREFPVDPNVIIVRNDSGGRLRTGDAMGLGVANTKLLTAVERERVWCIADKLTNCLRNCQVVVLLEPIESTKFGRAQIGGVGVAYVNVGAVWHRRAYPVAGADVLASGLFGPLEILVTPADTGEQLCFVRIGHADNRGVFVKTTSAITIATLTSGRLTLGSGTAKVRDPYTTAGQYSDSTNELTIYHMAGDAIASGKYLKVEPTDDWLPLAVLESCTEPEEPV